MERKLLRNSRAVLDVFWSGEDEESMVCTGQCRCCVVQANCSPVLLCQQHYFSTPRNQSMEEFVFKTVQFNQC